MVKMIKIWLKMKGFKLVSKWKWFYVISGTTITVLQMFLKSPRESIPTKGRWRFYVYFFAYIVFSINLLSTWVLPLVANGKRTKMIIYWWMAQFSPLRICICMRMYENKLDEHLADHFSCFCESLEEKMVRIFMGSLLWLIIRSTLFICSKNGQNCEM